MKNQHLVIIGNGIAGITCARHVRKQNDIQITVISAETDYFYSRTALMYIYMGHMRFQDTKIYEDWFWSKNEIDLCRGYVKKIDTDLKAVFLEDGQKFTYDKLLIATGSKSNKFGWPGQDLPGVQGLYSYQDLELMDENTKGIQRAVIVGGGLIGIEVSEMLQSRKINVTFLVREEFYWDNILPREEAKMIGEHIQEHGIELRLKTGLKEILPDENGRVGKVVTEFNEEIPCQFVALTPGVHPNIDVVRDSKVQTNRGILVNNFLETNIPDVYAAGDCAEIIVEEEEKRNRIEQLWYTGRMQGKIAAQNILGNKVKYDRGIWFNSAKFIDIEYQTYGFVSNLPREGEDSFYWEHPDHKNCLRIVFKNGSEQVVGMNFFGLRMKHKVCEKWIKERKTIDYVIENLKEANFDPEFFKQHEIEILNAYNRERATVLRPKFKESFFSRIFS
jgi:NAD(P)H-nitrite reductase large subunit